jgi:hypothetical protein
MMRQTGNPHFVAATIARAIINYQQPRKEKKERLLAELDARKARGDDIWPVIDALQMLDTLDAMGLPQEEGSVTHNATIARAIIDNQQPRKEKKERLLAELDARKARGDDIGPVIDALQTLDALDAMGLPQVEGSVTHKQAVRMVECLGVGVSKPAVTIETDAAGRRMVCGKPLPEAPRRRPDPDKALDLLRRGRTR